MLTLFHAPVSRSTRFIWLLEELGADYTIRYVDIHRRDDSGRVDPTNPHPDGKVPALTHDGVLVTESAAIALYLTDLHPEAELGPGVGDPLRGEYLSWLFYYQGVIEPLVVFDLEGLGGDPRLFRTFRGKDEMNARIRGALEKHAYLLGGAFSAVDLLLASMGQWKRDVFPEGEPFDGYLARLAERPALARAMAKDAPTTG